MNLIGWILLLYPIKLYYRRKWEGKHPGESLDVAWIRKRIDCKPIERYGRIIRCQFDRRRNLHFFLIEGSAALEWHTYQYSTTGGWQIVKG